MIKTRFDPKAFQKIADKQRAVKRVVAAANLDLWNGLVDETPVDVGNAQNAWWPMLDGAPASHVAPTDDVPKARPQPPVAQLLGSAGKRLTIANSAKYIRRLEYEGWSKQQPAGWVRRIAAKYPVFIRRRIREITSGARGGAA